MSKVKQSIPKELRYSVKDFNNEFPNDDACLEHIKEQRWPDGMAPCAQCCKTTKHHRVGNRTAYACQFCGSQIYPLVGTIFEKSSTSLRTWFYAMYLMGSTRCGISAKQIQRETGVTYKTAWRIFNRIRTLLTDDDVQMEGPTVEVDESYYGGTRKYQAGRLMRGDDDRRKAPMVAIVERGGKVIAKAVPNVSGVRILPMIEKHVAAGGVVYTDESPIYDKLTKMGFKHYTIRHKDKVYVREGHIHTNSVEGFWMLVKTGIRGVYHSVSAKYLQGYLNEYSFRFNRRHEGNQQFRSILERASRRVA
jgi:transposase